MMQTLLAYLDNLRGWMEGAVGLAAAFVGLIFILRGHPQFGVIFLISSALVTILYYCLYVAFGKKASLINPNVELPLYDKKYHPWAKAGIVLVAVIVVASLLFQPSRSYIGEAFYGTATPSPTATATPIPRTTWTPGPIPTPIRPNLVCQEYEEGELCAWVSNTAPAKNSNVTVYGQWYREGLPQSGSEMNTTWHYKTTKADCDGVTNSLGVAACTRSIGPATSDYTVYIYVSIEGRRVVTHFTPHE